MSERANFRGAGTGGRGASHHHSHHSHSHSHQHQRGGGGRGGRGGGGGSSSGLHANANTTTTGTTTNSSGNAGGTQGEKLKKENILDLGKYLNKEIRVKFNGGREGLWDFFFLSVFLGVGLKWRDVCLKEEVEGSVGVGMFVVMKRRKREGKEDEKNEMGRNEIRWDEMSCGH